MQDTPKREEGRDMMLKDALSSERRSIGQTPLAVGVIEWSGTANGRSVSLAPILRSGPAEKKIRFVAVGLTGIQKDLVGYCGHYAHMRKLGFYLKWLNSDKNSALSAAALADASSAKN